MSGDGHPAQSVDAGHEPETASSSKKQILKLKCPQWFTSGKYLDAPKPDHPNGNFSSFADLDGPKRRGRPPKGTAHQPARSSTRAKASTLPKPVATRSSRRKLAEVNGDAEDQDIEMPNADAASDVTGQDQAHQGQLESSRDQSSDVSMNDENNDLSKLDTNADGTIDGAKEKARKNGVSPPLKKSEKASNTRTPTIKPAAGIDSSNVNGEPIASIETHDRLDEDDDDDEPVGVLTRAAARSKSAAPNPAMLGGGGTTSVPNVEDSVMDESGMEPISVPGTPKTKGRGRWPNGALKAKAAAAGVSTATFKKGLGKKKGAPGKRKTSDKPEVQSAYDRQHDLKQQYRLLRQMLLKSEISFLDRTQDYLKEDPDNYKKTPNYDEVMEFLDKQHTAVVANREKEEQLQKQLLQREFDGEVSNTWGRFSNEVDDLMVKYEVIAKRAFMDVVQRVGDADDEDVSDNEGGGGYSKADLESFVEEQEAVTEVPTPEDNEPLKKGRAVPKAKRSKKRAFQDTPLVQQIAKRHAPAMLSATTHPDEMSEADKPAAPTPPPAALGGRGRNKYHFDEHGVYVPTEAKKGPQREEPNNRVVIQPWFEFEKHEIGLRNLYDERNEIKPKPQLPTGYWHLDPHRAEYGISNREEDFDQELVKKFGVHPTMGLPCRGSRNPDGVFPRTDYQSALKDLAPPLRYVDEEHPEPVSTSKSWDIIKTEREWVEFERRVRSQVFFGLEQEYGREGLATYDAKAQEHSNAQRAVGSMLEAAEKLERETPAPVSRRASTRTVSPSPGTRQSARQKARAEAAALKARPATPVTPVTPSEVVPPQPPQLPPKILSTANLSILADAADIFANAEMQTPPPPRRIGPAHSYHRSPPASRIQSQLPHISFINNPMPRGDFRPLAPQPMEIQRQQSQSFLQPRPQPMEMQRQYQPGMMAPPPLQPRMPLPYPSMHGQGPPTHQPPIYHSSYSPPQPPPGPPQRPSLRPGPPGLRSLLPRSMPGEPAGPPGQHHHVNHQQVTFYGGPPGPPGHMGPDHQRFYDGPPQHISPYRDQPYQPYQPGPTGPPGPPPGYGPFRHHSPRR